MLLLNKLDQELGVISDIGDLTDYQGDIAENEKE
jgi:hypothetical protein